MEIHSDHNDELDWIAFRYVAGDMADGEAAAFEERLATTQPAREAVARAAELTQVVARAERPRPRRVWRHVAGWAAAAAALGVGVWLVRPSDPPTQTASLDRASLAELWARVQLSDEGGQQWLEDRLALIGDDEPDLFVPGWLLEAVSGGDDKPDDDDAAG